MMIRVNLTEKNIGGPVLAQREKEGGVIYAAKSTDFNNAIVLKDWLEQKLKK